MNWVYRCMIIPVDFVPLAQMLSESFVGEAGKGMWTTALSSTGDVPETHYVSSGLISDEFASLIPLYEMQISGERVIASTGDVETIFEQSEGSIPREMIQALFDASDVTQEEVHSAIARMGLKLVQPTVEGI